MRKTETEILCDALGRVLGRYEAPRTLSAKERAYASRFLANVTKQKGERSMSKTTKESELVKERTNMVFISGVVQTVNIEEERAFFTVDVGLKQWVPCSSYKNEDIIKKLRGLSKTDFVQLKAIVRPWSQKDDQGEWKRGINIEVTEVKTIVKGPGAPSKSSTNNDDDLPF